MNKRAVLQNLRFSLAWMEKQLSARRTSDTINRALNTMVGCFEILAICGVPTTAWIDRRKGRRRALKNVRERYSKPDGNRALRQLLRLTITALEAAVWIKSLPVGALPTPKEPKPMTEAQRAQRRAASRKAHQKRELQRQRHEEAREARFALGA